MDDNRNLKLSSPWISYVHKLEALFGPDPDITVRYNEDREAVYLNVHGYDKAHALEQLLPAVVTFGNVSMDVIVVPDNNVPDIVELYRNALTGNPLFREIISITPEGSSNAFNYVMFKPDVIQYWDDNLGDPHGNISTLAQNLAGDVFKGISGMYFCTEPK